MNQDNNQNMTQPIKTKKLNIAKDILLPIGISFGLFIILSAIGMLLSDSARVIITKLKISLPMLIILFGIPIMLITDSIKNKE